jgi:hypothetical protein
LTTDAGPSDLAVTLVGPTVHRTTTQRDVVPDDLIDRLINSIGTWCG